MSLAAQRRDWDELAQLDPYWAICTTPGKRFGAWDTGEFFATGEREVAAVLAEAEPLGVPRRGPRRWTSGAGWAASRAPWPIASSAASASTSRRGWWRARASSTRTGRGASSASTRAPTSAQFEDGRFDLVYSSIVLQHVPRRDWIEAYLREFVRVLRPGGAIVFTLPSHIPLVYRAQWRRRLYHGLRRLGVPADTVYRRLRLQPIAMSFLPEAGVTGNARGGRRARPARRHLGRVRRRQHRRAQHALLRHGLATSDAATASASTVPSLSGSSSDGSVAAALGAGDQLVRRPSPSA